MLLHLRTWPEVESYLARSKGILVPIGSTEQHGPSGVIGTDAICAEIVARGAGEAADALVGPTIAVGMAQHHMAFPGTITHRPSTLIAIIEEYVTSLARHGFERFYFVNGHGGNRATLAAAFSQLYTGASLEPSPSSGPGCEDGGARRLRLRAREWFTADEVRAASRELFGEREGSHATPSEIAVTQYAHAGAIRRGGPLDPEVAPASTGFADAADFRRRYPDGRMGSDPSLATPEHGERLYRAAVRAIAEDYAKFMAED